MENRRGEKIGWVGGWLGGFIWVLLMSVIFLVQEKLIQGFLGLVLFCLAACLILIKAPWKHPDTPYWKLMLPVYVVFLASVAWVVWYGFDWRTTFWILPILIPLGTMGRRRWNDFGPRPRL